MRRDEQLSSPSPSRASPAASAPVTAPAQADGDNDIEARRLLNEGNQKVVMRDFPGAAAAFEQAIALKPSDVILGNLYRSLGVSASRQGKVDEGAKYYRLYLPYCQNPTEKAYLEKTLADFEALGKKPAAAP